MKKILLIEDDEMILRMVDFKLQKEGFKVYISKDGKEGLESIAEINPDLIITDVMMPYKSGIEITHHVRENHPNIPIIILSALGEEEKTVMEAFKLGVSDFISKPFNPNELVLRLKRFV